MAVTVKMNLHDGFEGGLELDEAVEVARIAETEGAHALRLSGGFTSKTPWYILRGEVPLDDIVAGERRPLIKVGLRLFGRYFVEPFPYSEAYFLDMALSVRKAVSLPLVLVGGLRSRAGVDRVLASGMDSVAMARALIYEPGFSARLLREVGAESQCTVCNRCVAAMYHGEQHCPARG
jgi:2,4-dienoyl-CoA reductase-like NADH-dependent reductase (Old Yellow Enzyme family)